MANPAARMAIGAGGTGGLQDGMAKEEGLVAQEAEALVAARKGRAAAVAETVVAVEKAVVE